MSFFIPDAYAAAGTTTAAQQGGGMTSILMIVAFVGLFYLLMWLPQSKRAKAQRELINGLTKGDEVVTIGGVVGRITKITDDFIMIAIAENVEVCIQKAAVAATLPKGTFKSIA
jgi:preprotein translocase subunit YajC